MSSIMSLKKINIDSYTIICCSNQLMLAWNQPLKTSAPPTRDALILSQCLLVVTGVTFHIKMLAFPCLLPTLFMLHYFLFLKQQMEAEFGLFYWWLCWCSFAGALWGFSLSLKYIYKLFFSLLNKHAFCLTHFLAFPILTVIIVIFDLNLKIATIAHFFR